MIVSIEGTLTVGDGKAVFDGKDPGFLWRGKATDYIKKKLSMYLNPATKLDELPRK
jgi:hypothetical protein